MNRFSFSSLRLRLISLVLLAVIPSLGLIYWSARRQRTFAREAARENASQLVRLTASHSTRVFEGARQLLLAVAQLPETRGPDPVKANAVLARLLAEYQYYSNLGVAKPDGTVVQSAVPLSAPVNVADRRWFQQAMETKDFVVGEYQMGRITHKPSINFAQPLRNEAGEVEAVVFASLNLSYFSGVVRMVLLPEGAQLTVVDRESRVLAQTATTVNHVGQVSPDAAFLKTVAVYHGQGTLDSVDAEGGRRIFAYFPVGGKRGVIDAYITMSIPTAVAFAQADLQLRHNLLGLTMVGLLALAAAWFAGHAFVLRWVSALVSAAQQMKAGNLQARTGMRYEAGELGQLAQVFDDMAASLEQREEELRKANAELEQRVQERTKELAHERNLLRVLIDNLPDSVYIKDLQGHYIIDNPTHRGILGAPNLEHVIGKTVFDFFPQDLAAQMHADDLAALAAQVPLLNREEQITDHKGRRIWVSTSKVPYRNEQRQVAGLVCITHILAEGVHRDR